MLIFGELLLNIYQEDSRQGWFLLQAIPLRLFSFLLTPLVKITSSVSSLFVKSAATGNERLSYLFDKEDIETLVLESHEAGVVNKKKAIL